MARKSQNSAKGEQFKLGDLVGAKVKGFPIWPAKIVSVDTSKSKPIYMVSFFLTKDTAKNFVELKPYKDITEKEKSCNRRGLREAFELCQKEFDSQIGSTGASPASDERTKVDDSSAKDDSICSSPAPNSLSIVEEDEGRQKQQKTGPKKVPETKQKAPVSKKRSLKVAKEEGEPDPEATLKKKARTTRTPKPSAEETEQKHDTEPGQDDDNAKITDSEAKHIGTDSSKPASAETTKIVTKVTTIKNRQQKQQPKPTKRMRSGRENADEVPDDVWREKARRMIKEKVCKVLEEKKLRKAKIKEQKIHGKLLKKYPLVIVSLMKFSNIVAQKLSSKKSIGKTENWETSVQRFTKSTLPVLARCIESDCHTKSTEHQNCQEILINLMETITGATRDEKTPSQLRDGFVKVEKGIKKTKIVYNFIKHEIEGQKRAMIERRVNDAE